MKSICVFCGAFVGLNPVYEQAARQLGEQLAAQDIELVWGGGQIGLMGALADAVLSGGGRTYGVMPQFMVQRELASSQSTELVVVDSMHERKAKMVERAEAFIALPGGFGTLDECFEIITWAQLHIHDKPIGLLNVNGFFDPLLTYLGHCSDEGFIRREHIDLLHVASDVNTLLETFEAYQGRSGDWLGSINF